MNVPLKNEPDGDSPSDLAALWQEALTDYYTTTGLSPATMPRYSSMADIENDRSVQVFFEKFRNNGGNLAKFRHLLASNSDLIVSCATHVANAASAAFPPSSAIVTALTLVMTASKDVSKDYDKIMTFFDEHNAFLERLSILEGRLPQVKGYRNQVLRVISAMLKVCGLTRKAVKDGRLKAFGKSLLRGQDGALSDATAALETAMKRLESATGLATLATGQETKEIATRIESRGEEIHHLVIDMNATQQRSEAEMREQFQAMSAKFDRMYEKQIRSAELSAANTQAQIAEPGLRKQAAFNTVNMAFHTKNSALSHPREIERALLTRSGQWLLDDQRFLSWKEDSTKNSIFWLTGSAGSGKSCLAYIVNKDLRLSTASAPDTSVVSIYLKDYSDEGQPMHGMLSSIINQTAARNVNYCEKVAASLNRSSSTINWEENDTVQGLWQQHIFSQFQSGSQSKLFLIIDGVDEVEDSEDAIAPFLNKVTSEKLQIQIFITSRELWESPEQDFSSHLTHVRLEKENVNADMRAIVRARIASSPRLCRCRKQTKGFIASQILDKADTMLTAEHMLLMLGQMHQEHTIIECARELPNTLEGIFETLEAAIVKNRRPQQVTALQVLFAWLAFANWAPTVNEANSLLKMHLDDQFFNFEEELSRASGQILEIVAASEEEDVRDGPDDMQEIDELEDLPNIAISEASGLTSGSASSILRFRSRSAQDYFTSKGEKVSMLRSPSTTSHAAIFVILVNLLCGSEVEGDHDSSDDADESLLSYAASSWSYHFTRIDFDHLSKDQAARVLRAVRAFLSNKGEVTRIIRKNCGRHDTVASSVGWSVKRYAPFFDVLAEWLESGVLLDDNDAISEDDTSWIKASMENINGLRVDTFRAFTNIWLDSGDWQDFVICYGFSLAILLTAEDWDVGFHEPKEGDDDYYETHRDLAMYTADNVKAIAFYAGDKKHWKTHRSAAIMMSYFDHTTEAFESFDTAMELTNSDSERAEVLASISELGHRLLVNSSILLKQRELVEYANSEPDETQSDNNSLKEPDGTVEDQQDAKNDIFWRYDYFRGLAEDVLALLDSVAPERRQQLERECALLIARSFLETGHVEEAIENYEKARQAIPEVPLEAQSYYMITHIYQGLGPKEYVERMQKWNFFEIMTWACTALCDSVTLNHPYHHVEDFQSAARQVGKQEFIIKMYESIISYQRARGGGMTVQSRFGKFYFYDPHETKESYSRAKELFYEVLMSKSQLDLITGKNDSQSVSVARNYIVDIIYEQFRATHDLVEKQALLDEMRKLQEENVNEILGNVDPGESTSAIVYACMIRKAGSNTEYEAVLNQTFESCISALKDADGANDQASFVLLAKVLACVPGLGRDARIAYSAQYSIIDQKVALTGPDGKIGVLKNNLQLLQGLTYGDVPMELLTLTEGGDISTAGAKSNDNIQRPTDRYRYVPHPQWGDVMPCKVVFCAGNRRHKIVHWTIVPTYLCVTCHDVQLCEQCYQTVQDANQGRKSWIDIGGARFCGRDHRYVKGPVEGWRGIRDGYLTIVEGGEEKRIPFDDWLVGLQDRWKDAWKAFWMREDVDSALD